MNWLNGAKQMALTYILLNDTIVQVRLNNDIVKALLEFAHVKLKAAR